MSCDMIKKDKYTEILTCKGIRFMKWGYQHKDYNIYYFRYEGLEDRPSILQSRGLLQCNKFYNKLIPVVFKRSSVYSFAILTRDSIYGRLPVFINEEFANEWIDNAFSIDVIGVEEYTILINEARYFIKKIMSCAV